MDSPRPLRFWDFVNCGLVKLTVRPGESLVYTTGGPTDEGYHYSAERWELTHDGSELWFSWSAYGRDCDGPYENHGSCHCPRELAAAVEQNGGLRSPAWQSHGRLSRDLTAEAAGY